MNRILFLVLLTLSSHLTQGQFKKADVPKGYELVYEQGFKDDDDLKDFEFSNAEKWLISKVGKPGKSLKCSGTGTYQPEEGDPAIVAVIKTIKVKDFILEMNVLQNGKDFSLLDICLFYGVQDVTSYCYAQLASKASNRDHNVFVVKDKESERIGTVYNDGVIWGYETWHALRLERSSLEKSVKLFMNDELIMEASDDPFLNGYIGFGSFDDAFKVDNIKIWAPDHEVVSNPELIFPH